MAIPRAQGVAEKNSLVELVDNLARGTSAAPQASGAVDAAMGERLGIVLGRDSARHVHPEFEALSGIGSAKQGRSRRMWTAVANNVQQAAR